MIKKVWALLSLLFTVTILPVACGPSRSNVDETINKVIATEESATTDKGIITLWHSMKEGEAEGLKQIIANFQERNSSVDIGTHYYPSDDIREKFETSVLNGRGPTLLIGTAEWGPAFYQGDLIADLAPLADRTFLQGINQIALDSVYYKNALIGVPLDLRGVILYRNNTIMTEAPTSAESMFKAAQAIKANGIVGANLEWGFFFTAGHLYGIGGRLMDENGNPMFNDEKGVIWLNLLDSFSDIGPTEYYTDHDVHLFKKGGTAMIIDATWNLNDIAAAIGEENLSIDPWPVGMSGFVQNDNIYMAYNAKDNDKAAAWAFIEYLLTPIAQAILADYDNDFIPAALGVEVPDRLRQESMNAFEGGVSFPVIPEMGAYWEPMDTALKSVFYEDVEPEIALKHAYDSIVAGIVEIRERK